eukprot:361046-Chlamydomonas_euryale.AAC.6
MVSNWSFGPDGEMVNVPATKLCTTQTAGNGSYSEQLRSTYHQCVNHLDKMEKMVVTIGASCLLHITCSAPIIDHGQAAAISAVSDCLCVNFTYINA